MSRYIDADALIAELQKDEERFDKEAEDYRKNSRNYTDCYMQAMSSRADGIRDAIVEVYDAPSIDMVRCKECKHWHREINESGVEYVNFSKCTKGHYGNGLDFHCADGEREGE
ncbi:MAG: hypothetical protein IIY21_22190 [Clostridiales bacterium]|nr:hypothetical protein [Clostridiales bacterium]